MKQNHVLSKLIIILLFVVSLTSCEDNENKDNQYVNNWIYKNMSLYYFWNDKIPSSPNLQDSPDKFFNSICYWYDQDKNPEGDRFSWIQNNYVDLLNSLSGVVSDEIGFEYQLYRLKNSSDLVGEILYVKKGTPAETSGFNRGQLFTEVNNTQLTIDNYTTVLGNVKGNYTLSFRTIDGDKLSDTKTSISSSTIGTYEENPIYFNTVFNYNGKAIGYLVYNFFADDKGDGLCGYDAQLAQVFSDFKSKNVTALILDLRYNLGGSSLASTALASMIVKKLNTQDIFYKSKCNSKLEPIIIRQYGKDFFNQYFIDKIAPDEDLNNLSSAIALPNIGNNLQELYIITSGRTASASELVISGLKPYMNVTLLGETTVGKNVASISIYEEDDSRNKWGMQPIVFKLYNKNDESNSAGFAPDFENEDDIYPKKELGNPEETMLSDAISRIAGVNTLRAGKQTIKMPYNQRIFSSLDKKPWKNTIISNSQTIFLFDMLK